MRGGATKKPSLRWNGQWREGEKQVNFWHHRHRKTVRDEWRSRITYYEPATRPAGHLFDPSSRLQTYRDLQMHALEVLEVPGARFSDIPEVSYIQWSP